MYFSDVIKPERVQDESNGISNYGKEGSHEGLAM